MKLTCDICKKSVEGTELRSRDERRCGMRLGDLDALKEIIETYRPIAITSDYLQGKNNMVDYCIAEIDNAPTVEPEPVSERQKRALAIVDALTEKRLINVMERGCLRRSIILEPERPQGEWIENVFVGGFVCSNCNGGYNTLPKTKYCPLCGAQMVGGGENE